MIDLLCATSNIDKFNAGMATLKKFSINLKQIIVDIDEIQGEDPEIIIKDKAIKAFKLLQKPVVVTDDSWLIPALNGFPGPYMKSINQWFIPNDFINLMKNKTNRSIILHKALAYADENEIVTFQSDVLGKIADKPAGNYGPTIMKVAIMSDSKITLSQGYDKGVNRTGSISRNDAWVELAKWYQKKNNL